MSVKILHGDCLAILPTLAADSVDAIVTDPPYELTQAKRTKPQPVGTGPYGRTRMGVNGDNKPVGGFMGKEWDGTGIAHSVEFWREALRVLKPGGHLLAFGGSRTYHRLACAVEDAGFEIRDQIQWLYGSGFPKSHDVSKGIDRAVDAERKIVGPGRWNRVKGLAGKNGGITTDGYVSHGGVQHNETAPATDAARQWEGWGTALKPACEPLVLARKPLIGTVAANVLKHGTGALNIDGCRVETEETITPFGSLKRSVGGIMNGTAVAREKFVQSSKGRWPANVIHDGSEEVVGAFPDCRSTGNYPSDAKSAGEIFGGARSQGQIYSDSGAAARFFYTAKADSNDRLGSKHPTVKPVDLIAYLCRLITPPKGIVLDPFAGSGTTGMACLREGFDCILIEREAEYIADIERRVAHVSGADAPLFAGEPWESTG